MIMKFPETTLGSILFKMGYLTKDEVNCAVSAQKIGKTDIPLGKILVANGLINDDQLKSALEVQEKLRSKNRITKAQGMAQVAENSCKNVIESVGKLKKRSDYIKKVSTGKGYKAITKDILTKDIID